MKDTPQLISQDSFHELVGLPYYSFDCYDLVKLFYLKVFGISLSEYIYDDPLNKKKMNFIINGEKKKFIEIKNPEFGDIALMKIEGVPCHLGIYLGKNKLMHTTVKTGSIVDNIKAWEKKIEAFYRYDRD